MTGVSKEESESHPAQTLPMILRVARNASTEVAVKKSVL
jgi:hypothetical protein